MLAGPRTVEVAIDVEHPAIWLRRRRNAVNMSQTELAVAVGRNQSNVCAWELGDGPPPEVAYEVFLALGASPEEAEEFVLACVRVRAKRLKAERGGAQAMVETTGRRRRDHG